MATLEALYATPPNGLARSPAIDEILMMSPSLRARIWGSTARIVKINGRFVEARPEGTLIIYENLDRPGMVGWIGTLMGKYGVNIASMSLGRNEAGGNALAVLNVDSVPPEDVLSINTLEQLAEVNAIYRARTGGGNN